MPSAWEGRSLDIPDTPRPTASSGLNDQVWDGLRAEGPEASPVSFMDARPNLDEFHSVTDERVRGFPLLIEACFFLDAFQGH